MITTAVKNKVQHSSLNHETTVMAWMFVPRLPSYETTLNIISFGSRTTTKSWDQSRQYSQTTLEEAMQHVDTMSANYRGTEIAAALSPTYSSLPTPLAGPVAVILLTDGSAWDVSTCVSHTETALSTPPEPKQTLPHPHPSSAFSQ
ncbi:hypothetical protein F5880DRAFT_1511802 [Lentinula raphanica]|nr:hypothetical protein F5880DRAFT_1511802 [Lentinula raphanica]